MSDFIDRCCLSICLGSGGIPCRLRDFAVDAVKCDETEATLGSVVLH